MYKTKIINEEFALEEKGLEKLILRKVSSLYQDSQEVGQVLQIAYNHHYCFEYSSYELQAEFYQTPLPADLFFEKGLVRRANTNKPVQLDKPLEGIVFSKGDLGVHYGNQNCLFLRPEGFAAVLGIIADHAQQRETFAEYRASGHSWCGFLGYYYQPPGPDQKEKKFFKKGKDADSISTRREAGPRNEIYEYRNGEKASLTKPLGETGIEVIINRNELVFKRGKEWLQLQHHQISALKKMIELYTKQSERT